MVTISLAASVQPLIGSATVEVFQVALLVTRFEVVVHGVEEPGGYMVRTADSLAVEVPQAVAVRFVIEPEL